METKEEKYNQAKQVIQQWVDKQGHDRCWYYPELFKQLQEIFEITATKKPKLPPYEEFKQGCKRYQKEEFNK